MPNEIPLRLAQAIISGAGTAAHDQTSSKVQPFVQLGMVAANQLLDTYWDRVPDKYVSASTYKPKNLRRAREQRKREKSRRRYERDVDRDRDPRGYYSDDDDDYDRPRSSRSRRDADRRSYSSRREYAQDDLDIDEGRRRGYDDRRDYDRRDDDRRGRTRDGRRERDVEEIDIRSRTDDRGRERDEEIDIRSQRDDRGRRERDVDEVDIRSRQDDRGRRERDFDEVDIRSRRRDASRGTEYDAVDMRSRQTESRASDRRDKSMGFDERGRDTVTGSRETLTRENLRDHEASSAQTEMSSGAARQAARDFDEGFRMEVEREAARRAGQEERRERYDVDDTESRRLSTMTRDPSPSRDPYSPRSRAASRSQRDVLTASPGASSRLPPNPIQEMDRFRDDTDRQLVLAAAAVPRDAYPFDERGFASPRFRDRSRPPLVSRRSMSVDAVPPPRTRSSRRLDRRGDADYARSASRQRRRSSVLSHSEMGLGVGTVGAVAGGLVAQQAQHARARARRAEGEADVPQQDSLWVTALGAAVGGLGANALVHLTEGNKDKDKDKDRERARQKDRLRRERSRRRDPNQEVRDLVVRRRDGEEYVVDRRAVYD